MKIRGTAGNIYEKYLQMARDAGSAGDRVAQENYLQHAEHYYRIMMANQTQYPQQAGQQQQGPQQQGGQQGNYQQQPNAGSQGAGDGRNPNATPQPYPQGQPVPGSGPSFTLTDEANEAEESEADEAAHQG